MLYSFWYGRRSVSQQDLDDAKTAIALLRNNQWKAETSVYINGSGFSSNKLREAVASSILDALQGNASAKTLILQNIKLTSSLQKGLLQVFEKNSSLRVIRLDRVYQDSTRPFVVPALLFSRSSLEELSLEGCCLDEEASTALSRMLSGTDTKLRRLSLKNLCLSSQSDMRRILGGIEGNMSVKELYLEKVNLLGDLARTVARTVARNKTLSKLSLRCNALGPEFVRILVHNGLKHNRTLETLYLSRNNIGDLGAKYIAEGLQEEQGSPRYLRELCLVNASIGREGCRAIALGLATMPSLRKLSMDGNDVFDCAPHFLESLQTNYQIRQIMECSTMGHTSTNGAERAAQWSQVDLFLRWNRAKRSVLGQAPVLPAGLLPHVVNGATGQPDVLHQFVREMPCLTQHHNGQPGGQASRSNASPRVLVTEKVQRPDVQSSSLTSLLATPFASLSNTKMEQLSLPTTTSDYSVGLLKDRRAFMTGLLSSAVLELDGL